MKEIYKESKFGRRHVMKPWNPGLTECLYPWPLEPLNPGTIQLE